EGVKFGHLRHADGRLDVGEAQVKTEPAKRHHGPGPMRLERRIWRAGRAMIAQASNKTGEIVTTRRDDAALTGGHYLARIERETADVADRADRPASVTGPDRTGCILDDCEVVAPCDPSDLVHLRSEAEQMDCDDSPGARRDRRCDCRRIKVVGVKIDVHED